MFATLARTTLTGVDEDVTEHPAAFVTISA
jgi:hypothetical protein